MGRNGGIKLYSTINDLYDLLANMDRVEAEIQNNILVRYEIKGVLYLFFHLRNSKLYKITTLSGYEGRLFDSIDVNTTEKEFLKIEPGFEYNDFEEVFETHKGVFIETDPITEKPLTFPFM